MPLVTSGVDHGNLRELALQRMEELDLHCRDVRTRGQGDIFNDIYYITLNYRNNIVYA